MTHLLLLLAVPTVLATAPESPPDLRLLIGGRGGGLSAHFSRMLAPDLLAGPLRPSTIRRVGYAAFERHGCVLFSQEPVDLKTLRQRVEDPHRQPLGVQTITAARSVLDLTWDDASGTLVQLLFDQVSARQGGHTFSRVNARLARWHTAHGDLWSLETETCTPQDLAIQDPLEWEVRSVTEMVHIKPTGQVAHVWSVARPLGEGTRRHVQALEMAETSRREGTHFVELLAGDDIEGASYLQIRTNLQRPITEDAMEQRRPAVWVPQATELHEGIPAFARLCRRVGAVPVSANLAHENGTLAMEPYAWVPHGEKRILVIGVTDPQTLGAVPAEVGRDMRVLPAGASVAKALDRAVKQLGRWPDLVVALGVLEPEAATEVAEVPGVDVAYLRFEKSYADVHAQTSFPADAERATHPAVLTPRPSPWRVETTDVWWPGPSQPDTVRVVHQATALTLEQTRDEALSRRVQQQRQPIYEAGSETVVGDVAPLMEGPRSRAAVREAAGEEAKHPARLGRTLWGNLTAAIVQDATGADVALTPPAREMWRAPGGFTELRLQAALAGQDALVALLLPGPELEKVVRQAHALGMGVAGMKDKLVGGRLVDAKERYLVITTEASTVRLGIEDKIKTRTFFTLWKRRVVPAMVGGSPVLYRTVVMDRLTHIRDTLASNGQFGDAYLSALAGLLVPRGGGLTPRLVLEARDLTMSVTVNEVRGRESYPQVPDSRVRTPNNTAILLNGMARASLETRYGLLELRGVARWDRRIFAKDSNRFNSPWSPGNNVTEAFNTWNLTLEARQPALGLPLHLLQMRTEPYISASYESLFWRMPRKLDQSELPPVAFGRLSTGAAVFGQVVLKEMRIGVVAQQDFRQPLYSPTGWRAPGMSVGLESSLLAGFERGRLGMDITGSWRWLAPRPGVDTPRDLALTGGLRSALKAKVMDGISLSVFGDAYGFLGKQHGDMPGLDFMAGVGVAADRRWKPMSELGFFW